MWILLCNLWDTCHCAKQFSFTYKLFQFDKNHSKLQNFLFLGHLPLKLNDFKKRYRTLTSTYVTFSPDGKDMLANLGGEQIYLFNIVSRRKQLVFDMSEKASNFNAKGSSNKLKTSCCGEYVNPFIYFAVIAS